MGYPKDLQFWNCCKSQKGYSGTAILVHKDFVGKVEKVEMDFGKPGKHDQEGRCVTAHFQSCVLVCTYVPNSGVIGLNRLKYRTEEWDIDLQAFLKELQIETGKPVIWCGDLNVGHKEIDIYNPKGKEN